jgi:hypothetical protein
MSQQLDLPEPTKFIRNISAPEQKLDITEPPKLVRSESEIKKKDDNVTEERYLELLELARQTKPFYNFIEGLRAGPKQKYYKYLLKNINFESCEEKVSVFVPWSECVNDPNYLQTTLDIVSRTNTYLENECKSVQQLLKKNLVTFQQNYFSYETMLNARCSLQALLYNFKLITKNYTSVIKPGINETIVLDSKTASGAFGRVYFGKAVFTTKTENITSDSFILKVVKKRQNVGILLHEVTIGNILNRLRRQTPSFMYSFGGMYCPIKFGMTDNRELCNSDLFKTKNLDKYIKDSEAIGIFEAINSSKSLDTLNYLRKCSFADFVSILLHVASSLNLAQKRFNFMHNDLHLGNVMLRLAPKSDNMTTKIVYMNKDKSIVALDNKYNSVYPVIIDYGLSTCNAIIDTGSKTKVYVRPPVVHEQQLGKCWIIKEPHFIPSFDFVFFFLNCLQFVDSSNINLAKDGSEHEKYKDLVNRIISYFSNKVRFCNTTIDQIAILVLNKYNLNSAQALFIQPLIFDQYRNLSSDDSDLVDIIDILLEYIETQEIK